MGFLADHFRRVTAAQQAARSVDPAALEAQREDRTQYEQMLLLLDSHQQQLRNLQSMEARAAHKLKLLPEYAAYLDGVIEAGQSQQDNVLVTLMLWHFDCALIDRALDLASVALASNMAMPEQHRRSLPCVVVEETADLLLAGKGVDNADQAIYAANRAAELTAGKDMPDPVSAKLLKALGRAQREQYPTDPALAMKTLTRALELDKNVGVKKDIEQLERAIKKAAEATDPTDQASAAGVGSGA